MNLATHFKKILSTTVITALVLALGYTIVEPSVTGASVTASDTVVVTLNVTTGVSITHPADSTMSIDLGAAQNTAVGTTTWNVKTNSSTGYSLTVQASTDPAMQSGSDVVADYQTTAPNTWSVASGAAQFGYSAYGTDVDTGTWGTGSTCGSATHVPSASLNYLGFTTSPNEISSRSSTTTTAGIDSTVCYAVEQNGFYIPSGTYTATITATATAS